MTRRKARETALQTLYKLDIAEAGEISEGVPAGKGGDDEFSSLLVEGTREHLLEIDALIERLSEHWSIGRMAVVDRNILRMAMFELRYYEKTPYRVVIDEAVELAKKFGSEESSAFINGVLDSVRKMMPSSIHLTAG
ncbi:MAG: transcription antitermination factor NusB [Thermodesulfobacteriota bacterium]